MANTIGSPVLGGAGQFQGLFNEVFTARAVISDQDAIDATDTIQMAITVPGAASGDFVWVSIDSDLNDNTDLMGGYYGVVTTANTVGIRFHADVGEFAADDLNGKTVRVVVLRPGF